MAAPQRRTSTISDLFSSAKVTPQNRSKQLTPSISSNHSSENHKIASLLISKSVRRLMRGARIRRRKPHRFLTTRQTASRPISGRSTSGGGGGGGVRGVGDRLQASLLRHCARQVVPQELASSLFRAACFLIPLLVQIPAKDGSACDKRNFLESKEILTSAICWSSL